MKKQLILFLMMLLPMAAWADDSGTCGENITWTYEEATQTLTISGSGDMYINPYENNCQSYILFTKIIFTLFKKITKKQAYR